MKPVLPKPSEERKAVVRRMGNASLEREVASDRSPKLEPITHGSQWH